MNGALQWLAQVDARIWQAVVAGVFLAGGWVFNGRQNRRQAERLRAEMLRDTHRAIFAEIESNLSNLSDAQSLDAYCEEIVARMEEDQRFIPLIPRERNDRLFESIQSNIHILPRVTIDPIVIYYSQLDTLAAHVEDMRGHTFKTLESSRRVLMYKDYIEMKKRTLEYGRVANYLIDVYSKSGKDAAEAEVVRLQRQRLSSPVLDRSDP